MKFPVVELLDRYTIAQVKYKKTSGANQAELDFYTEQLSELNTDAVSNLIQELADIHETIWGMEDDFKKCREAQFSLEEIGRRALAIRDINNRRVRLKNHIADLLDADAVRDIKQDHVSQTNEDPNIRL